MSQITLKGLSEKIGVSTATISLVLNNKPGISADTRKYVLEKVEQYGYERLRVPAKKTRAHTVCLFLMKVDGNIMSGNDFFSRMIESIEGTLSRRNSEFYIKYLDEIPASGGLGRSERSDGIIIQGTLLSPDDILSFRNYGAPLLVLDNSCSFLDVSSLSINNEQGIRKSLEYLREMGHSKIGFIRGSNSLNNFSERFLFFKRAAAELGVDSGEHISASGNLAEDYRAISERLRTDRLKSTAFVACNDHIAFSAIKAFKDIGIRVPDDISITGFDNNALCEIVDPMLTTVNVPVVDMGRLAADRILYMIENPGLAATHMYIDTNIIERGSVARIPPNR